MTEEPSAISPVGSSHSHRRAFILMGVAIVALALAIVVIFWVSLPEPAPLAQTDRQFFTQHFDDRIAGCAGTADQAQRALCIEGYLAAKASVLTEPESCFIINNTNIRNDCLDQATLKAALANNDPSVCVLNFDPQGCKDRYADRVARTSDNEAGCDDVFDPLRRDQCHDSFGLKTATQDPDNLKCEILRQDEAREECLGLGRLPGTEVPE